MLPRWLLPSCLFLCIAVQSQGTAIHRCDDDGNCDEYGEPKICIEDKIVTCGSNGEKYQSSCTFASAKCKNPYLVKIPCYDSGPVTQTPPTSTCPPTNENYCPLDSCTTEWVTDPDTGCHICQCKGPACTPPVCPKCIPEYNRDPVTNCLTCGCMETCPVDVTDLICPTDCLIAVKRDNVSGCMYCYCRD